ncbi:MAG: PIN domain-containing protein [Deltaproteobacteria bacterium]|nr:PIN domain-containing protein [Deltaproteobacteria bacterium]
MNNRSDENTQFSIVAVESNPYLLDTSALLSFIEDEEGADRVEQALKQTTTLLPWPVLLETCYITIQEEGQAEADRRIALIKQLNVKILWDMDESTLLTAARLKAEYRVSLADAIIAAFAIRKEAVLMHKDPEFDALNGLLPMEALPYK